MADIPKDLCEIHFIGPGTRERIVHPDTCAAMRRHGMGLAGLSRVDSGEFEFCRLRPNMVQVLVVLDGNGEAWLGNPEVDKANHGAGEWRMLKAGDAYVTPSAAPHAYRAKGRWEIGWCMFAPEAFEDFHGGPKIREVNPTPWFHILSGLCEESVGPGDAVQLERWVELLHHECTRLIASDDPRRLWRLWTQVSEDLRAPWTLASLAQRAGMSEETLRVLCHREMGRSPMVQVTLLRMRYAAALLETGQKVDYVSGLVGYENAFAFSTAFRRVMGVTPSSVKRVSLKRSQCE